MALYQYDITDFANDSVNLGRLTHEITIANIDPTLNGITSHNNLVDIEFQDSLSAGEETTLDNIVSAHNGQPMPDSPLDIFLDENAEVEVTPSDSTGSITGQFHIMQTLVNRREIFNDMENPLYDSNVTPILGSGGILQDHADKISNLETIHGKTGWHNQQVIKSAYQKPSNLLIYYGWLNSFNSSVNSWNNEKVAQDMAKYSLIVIGDGIQDSGHGDYSNTEVIIPRIKALNPNAKIFGYVTINQSLANFESKVDDWETLQVDGIFLDESGYDYGSTTTNGRDAFNTKVDYVHGQTYANLCFVNAWNMDHIIGTANDVSYPNTTWNPNLVESNLTYNDYYLLESFAVNTLVYGTNYEVKTDWSLRGDKAQTHRYNYGINLVASCVIEDGHADTSDLFHFAFTSAMMFALEGFGSSDDYYGASSAKNTFIERPDVTALGEVYSLSTTVQVDVGDSDVYHRYIQFGKLSLDFSSGAQTSTITKF